MLFPHCDHRADRQNLGFPDFPLELHPGLKAQGCFGLPFRPGCFGLAWIRSGSLFLQRSGQSLTASAGEILCFGPDHRDWEVRAHALNADFLCFDPSLLGQTLTVCRLMNPETTWSAQEKLDKWPLSPFVVPEGLCAISLLPPSDLRAQQIIGSLAEQFAQKDHPFWRCLCRTAVLEILFLVTRTILDARKSSAPGVSQAVEDKLVASVLLELRSSLDQRPTLAELARKFAVNRSSLAQRFKQTTGTTVGAWLTEQRLALAERLVRETGLPFYAIGERVGWTDPTHFQRTFKRRFGVSPSAWRRGEN